jgi:hypothetical protein
MILISDSSLYYRFNALCRNDKNITDHRCMFQLMNNICINVFIVVDSLRKTYFAKRIDNLMVQIVADISKFYPSPLARDKILISTNPC